MANDPRAARPFQADDLADYDESIFDGEFDEPDRFDLAGILAGRGVTGVEATREFADRVETLWAAGETGSLTGDDAEVWRWSVSHLGAAGLVELLAAGSPRAQLTGLVIAGCDFLAVNAKVLKRYVRQSPAKIAAVADVIRAQAREDIQAAAETLLGELNTLEPVLKAFANKKSQLPFGNRPRWVAIDLREHLMPVLSPLRAYKRANAAS